MTDFIEPTIPELEYMTVTAKNAYLKSIEEKMDDSVVQFYDKLYHDCRSELEYRTWLATPTNPFIGLTSDKDLTEDEKKQDRERSKMLYLMEYMFKLKKAEDRVKLNKSASHIVAVIQVAKENKVDIYV